MLSSVCLEHAVSTKLTQLERAIVHTDYKLPSGEIAQKKVTQHNYQSFHDKQQLFDKRLQNT